MPNDGNCFRCGQPGHWDAHCPLRVRAKTKAEHEQRIQLYIDRWVEFAITALQKQALIREENELWKPKETTGARK